MRCLFFLFFFTFIASLNADPIKVLVITGQNNHNWKATNPIIVDILESTGKFDVTVTKQIEAFDPSKLSDFDVIFSNWNLWKHRKDMPEKFAWSPELKEAYVDFVRDGGGHVAMHAGSSTFFDWDDYQEICVATWKAGTHHGPRHVFDVRIDVEDHPVTEGLGDFSKYDELWESIYISAEDPVILTSGYASKEFRGDDVWEPTTLVSQFGEGRTAYTSFGHDVQAFESEEFQVLLARLVEWAATGEVTIPPPTN
ncbi:MAG: ThuA domain-containing protein [Verrucomicrobiota bacterium]